MKIAICSLSHFTYVAEFIDAAALLNEQHEVKYFLGFSSPGSIELLETRGIDYEVLLESPPYLRMPAEISATDELFRDFFFKQAELVLKVLLERLAKWQPSIILSHLRDYSGITAAEVLNLPVVSFGSHSSPFRDPSLDPPFASGVSCDSSTAILDLMWKMHSKFNDDLDDEFNRSVRRPYGLEDIQAASTLISRELVLLSIIPSLGNMKSSLPPYIKYVGPLFSRKGVVPSDGECATLEKIGELPSPRVFISLGTIYTETWMEKCVEALVSFEGTVIVSSGKKCSSEVGGIMGNTVIAPFFEDVDAILSVCDAVVTTSGGKTVMDALSHGLPMVCLPQQGEQKEIALALKSCGVAELPCVLKWDAEAFTSAVRKVVSESSYRRAAESLKLEISQSGGAGEAAKLVIQVAEGFAQ